MVAALLLNVGLAVGGWSSQGSQTGGTFPGFVLSACYLSGYGTASRLLLELFCSICITQIVLVNVEKARLLGWALTPGETADTEVLELFMLYNPISNCYADLQKSPKNRVFSLGRASAPEWKSDSTSGPSVVLVEGIYHCVEDFRSNKLCSETNRDFLRRCPSKPQNSNWSSSNSAPSFSRDEPKREDPTNSSGQEEGETTTDLK